jgi:hypothetical protein
VAKHHRHWGSADGRLRGRARHGQCAWILHHGLGWATLRSLKVALVPPRGLSGIALSVPLSRSRRARDCARTRPPFRRFARRELRRRMLPASIAR